MTTVTQTRRPEPARRAPFRLRGRTRKIVLILHILSVGTWVGVDVIVAVLVLTGWLSADPSTRGLAYQALGTFVVWPMLVSGLVSLVTGVILGVGSKYGLVRYWWVAVKLVLNVVLCTLILVALQPGLGLRTAEVSERIGRGKMLECLIGAFQFLQCVFGACHLLGEPGSALVGDRVVLAAAAGLGDLPARLDVAKPFESMEDGVEHPVRPFHPPPGKLAHALEDRVAVAVRLGQERQDDRGRGRRDQILVDLHSVTRPAGGT